MLAGRRIRPARPRTSGAGPRAGAPFVVEELTNHWTRRGDRWYREVWVRLPDGTRRLYGFPDEELTAA